MSSRERKSPGGLVIVSSAPCDAAVRAVDSMHDALMEAASGAIIDDGGNPEELMTIIDEQALDRKYFAALLLRDSQRLRECRTAISEADDLKLAKRRADQAIECALRMAWNLWSMTTVENEPEIVSGTKSLDGAREGGKTRSEAVRNARWVKELTENPSWPTANRKQRAEMKKALAEREGVKYDALRKAVSGLK